MSQGRRRAPWSALLLLTVLVLVVGVAIGRRTAHVPAPPEPAEIMAVSSQESGPGSSSALPELDVEEFVPDGYRVAAHGQPGGRSEADQKDEVVFKRLKIERHNTKTIPLNQNCLECVTDEGKSRAVPVVLKHSQMSYVVEFVWRGKSYRRSETRQLYELQSRDSEVEYTSHTSFERAAHEVTLFAHGPGANYLAVVIGPSICVWEVSRSTDVEEGLRRSYAASPPFTRGVVCQADRAIGHQPFVPLSLRSDGGGPLA